MGKLSCYCIDSVLLKFGVNNSHMGIPRSGYMLPSKIWHKLCMYWNYRFYDRLDEGYPIDFLIHYFKVVNTNHKLVLRILCELKLHRFEDYSISTVSKSLLMFILNLKENNLYNRKKEHFITRYGIKRYRKLIQKIDSDYKFTKFMNEVFKDG